jgi:hypothetical protein
LEKTNKGTYVEFKADHPGVETAISTYNQQVARLDRLRKKANDIRTSKMDPIDKEGFLKLNITEQNMVKRSMIERMELYGIKP